MSSPTLADSHGLPIAIPASSPSQRTASALLKLSGRTGSDAAPFVVRRAFLVGLTAVTGRLHGTGWMTPHPGSSSPRIAISPNPARSSCASRSVSQKIRISSVYPGPP